MEGSDEVIYGCVELFFTIRKEFKVRCRCCEGIIYFYTMKDYIEHWLNNHREPLSWFTQPSMSSVSFLELKKDCLTNQPTLVIKPSTRSFEVYCNRCKEHNFFENIEDYIAHFLENHQNLVKTPYEATKLTADSSESAESFEYVGIEEDAMKNLKDYKNLESNLQGLQMHENLTKSQTYTIENDSFGSSPYMGFYNLQHNLQSKDYVYNNDIDTNTTKSVQHSKLQRQLQPEDSSNVLTMNENASNRNPENSSVELIFSYPTTSSTNSDIKLSSNSKTEEDIAQEIVLKNPKQRLLYFSQISNLFQRNSVNYTQEIGLIVEIGILSIRLAEKNFKNHLISSTQSICFEAPENDSKIVKSNCEEILPNSLEENHSVDIETIESIKEETQEVKEYNTRNKKQISTKTNKTNLSNRAQPRQKMDLMKFEVAIDNEETAKAYIMKHDSSKTRHEDCISPSRVSSIKSELSSSMDDATSIASANQAENENTSIVDNSNRITRSRGRKRKANNIDRENDLKKKMSKKTSCAIYCTICEKSFQRSVNYEVHMKKYHPLTKCYHCKIEFPNSQELLQHLKMHCNDKQCPYCHENILWYNKAHLQKHFHLLNCKSCEFFTCIEDILKTHELTCSDLICKVCNLSFQDATKYRRHAFHLHQNSKPFECRHCDQQFSYLRAMKAHEKTDHRLDVA